MKIKFQQNNKFLIFVENENEKIFNYNKYLNR
jgi:hypothetical protein